MNSGKIFLINVSKGRIGEDNSALLGAMLITKIQLASMERVRVPENERVDFYLYVDEFQNFATDSFAGILSEARKYRLNLILAHQYIGQLVTDVSTKVRDAIFGNVGTMLVFRVGAADAEFLEKEFEPEFTIQDIVNLPNFQIYLKLMVSGVTCRPFSAATLPPFKVESSPEATQDIIQSSRKRYGRPRHIIEEEINRWSGMMSESLAAEAHGASGAARYDAVCSACGKATKLPFEPTPGRPVYCKECLQKIKAGEMQPVRMPRGGAKQPREKYLSDLAGMGIEFDARSEGRRPAGGPPREERKQAAEEREPAPPRTAPAPLSAPAPPALSLSELKPVERTPKQRPAQAETDIEELRHAIAESLSKAAKGEDAAAGEEKPEG
ncbi:MAG: hypothetical protein A2681_01830 [Candidatus Liptonbacteria bacterium RIFCSPHIGHO2_01_FULL_56_18b]|nr:MAG: hypothetical protein A2681_01830 [Candidatus Liptonbacteria bacterium RIFCSPHIGHO2_01_FULL_56_18b]